MPNGDQRYDTQEYAGDSADDVSVAMQHMPQEDRSSNAEVQASITDHQQEQLAGDVEMGDDRVVVPQNWDSRTSTELYQGATDKNVPTSADDLGRGFTKGGNDLAEAANRLLGAVTKLDHAWQGEAADAARNALTPLATKTGQAGQSAQFMGTAMSDQAMAAATVRNMPEPMEFDRDAAMTAALANPNPVAGMADMQAKEQQAKAVKDEQVTYMNTYTTTMAEIDSRTPTFVPPPPRGTDTGGGGGFQGGHSVNYNGPGGGGGFTPSGSGHTGNVSGYNSTTGNPSTFTPVTGGNGIDTSTDISGYTPPSTSPVMQPPLNPNPTPTPTPQPNTVGTGPAPMGQFGGRGPGGPGTGGGSRPGGTGGMRPGMGGPGTGSGAGTGNARPGMGPGAGTGNARPGMGAGMGQGGSGAGRPGGPAGAGGAGGRGGMGAGGMGGRGGQGEEDNEHQRPSYLVEPDPEDTFGTDQVTAPPVIGE